jgi:tetratricopeptide (TPR) repeat protein
MSSRTPIALLVAATWLVFLPSLRAKFVLWDDPDMVCNNPGLRPPSLAHVRDFWTGPTQKLYTPLAYTAWSVVAALEDVPPGHHLRPGAFHLLNLLLHTAAVVLVFMFVKELVGAVWPAWAGAMLFAIHPLQVEPVTWVSGMNNVLCGVFSVAALWQYLVYAKSDNTRRLILATALYAAALLSKPTALMLPLLAAVLDLGIARRPIGRAAAPLAIWLVMAVAIGVATRIAQPPVPSQSVPWYDRPVVATDTIGFYFSKLIAPVHLAMDYERKPARVMLHAIVAWRGCVVLLAAAVILLQRRLAWLRLPVALTLLALLPVLGLVPFDFQDYSTVADRYMYLPMLGIAVGAGLVAKRLQYRASRAVIVGILCTLAGRAFAQTLVWHDTQSLAANQLRIDPDSSTGHKILAEWLAASGRDNQAEPEFLRAIAALQGEGKTGDGATWFDYANLLRRQGRNSEAIRYYQLAIPRLTTSAKAEAFNNLGIALAELGDKATAREQFRQALILRPDYADARDNLRRVGGSD